MTTKDLGTRYEPHQIEDKWYHFWETQGYFRADAHSPKPPYSIVIPPPNITGSLHIGHALNNTLQDILIRWKRMEGYNTLWLPGTDHAGIATQYVIDQQLAQEGLTRQQLGRERYIERIWKWREESGGTILRQLRKLGASCDWERERFTMDEGLSRAVREVFVSLYEEGYIYRDAYIISWCPRCHTALSDLEVEYEEVQGNLYYIAYPLVSGKGAITVATTRPETMLGDTAVAVHPEDTRYRQYVGQEVILPLVGRRLPIIADSAVDPTFGTGALKITPAHDANDFVIGNRHELPRLQVIDEEGKMNAEAGPYQGLDRFACRERVVQDLKVQEFLERVQPYTHGIGHCYRCQTIVEPTLSTQWFVRIKPLAEPAIAAVREGRIRIMPVQWENTYFDWMLNIRDWCISRQLWWGHRIPAWYCQHCGETMVARDTPLHCKRCQSKELVQEEDVLDTWFSSGLWPFSTLGWPEQTPDLQTFYPTSVLVTAFDILFFWVARMIMFGLKFQGEVPFRDVYIHALVRDAEGHKMSKSRGNVIDPLTVMEQYGTDALRFTLAALAAQGRDIRLSEDRIAGYRNFANKIWNAFRFSLMHFPSTESLEADLNISALELADRWILSRLTHVIGQVNTALAEYRFNDAAGALYQFFWHELCDWYIELVKLRIEGEPEHKETARQVLFRVLETTLRLLHPFMPFITEELWQSLPHKGASIMVAPYPHEQPEWIDETAERDMQCVQAVITAIRNIRSEMNISPLQKIRVLISAPQTDSRALLQTHAVYLTSLANLESLTIDPEIDKPASSATAVVGEVELFVPLVGLIDFTAEEQRLRRELEKVEKDLKASQAKLANEHFLQRAPAEVVTKEREKYEQFQVAYQKLKTALERLTELR